jgi:uncharacterized protein YjbI with pentapeptide repeats
MIKISFCTVTLVLSAFLSPFITSVSAQNNTDFTSELIDFENQSRDSTLSYTKWRVTFLNSLGTNGNNSQEYTAQYSINLVGGIHGGLDGREFGLLYNVETNYVHGFQIAGLGNVSLGEMSGLNIAGLSNYSQGPMKGLQLSGLANISETSMEGLQLSAGLNVSAGELSGMHIAGIANLSQDDLAGLNLAGGFNVTNEDIEGLNLAGIANISNDDIEGLTIAGIANVSAEDQSGLIMSSVANVSGDFMEGLILTGGINAAKKIEGLSVSGVATLSNDLTGLTISPVNIQKTITGLHVGFVNVAEEIDGVSIGLVSWYGNGRKNVDIRYSDSGFLDMGFTTGTHRLYNQISVGFVPQESNVFKLGGSIGLVFDMRDRFSGISKDNWTVTHELSLYQYMEDKWHRQNTKQFTYRYLISSMPNNQFSIYAGPSLNILKEGSVDDLAWYSVWSPSIKSANYQVWVGFNIGMRLFKQEAVERVNFPLERNF